MSKGRLNNLTDVLGAIDKGDRKYMDKLSPEQRKDLSSNLWLMMRYCSDVSGDFKASEVDKLHYLTMTHLLVNRDFMKMSDHPDLQWKLLAHCGVGRKMYHNLLPPFGAKKVNKKVKMLSQIFQQTKVEDIEVIIALKDESELKELCLEYGYDKKDIDSAFKG